MTKSDKKASASEDRKKRLAEQLRNNLRKRKAQMRQRDDHEMHDVMNDMHQSRVTNDSTEDLDVQKIEE